MFSRFLVDIPINMFRIVYRLNNLFDRYYVIVRWNMIIKDILSYRDEVSFYFTKSL